MSTHQNHTDEEYEDTVMKLEDLDLEDKESEAGTRYESIQRCVANLLHACQCRDANCPPLTCHKMKRVVNHTWICKKRKDGTCPVCKQLVALCCYHAKECSMDICSVPFCKDIR
uniref:histone acetyltransferase n=1 Tax=Caenorhabditis tropicalis TaxID=1561998 RepID=A0A1I7UH47_9PELO